MSVLAIQGLALFAFIPLVLFLFLQLPLGAGWSLALGLGLMLGHRFVASPWMAAHAAERCLWCARSLPGSRLPILIHAGGRNRVMTACRAEHAELVSRFLGCVQRFRVLIAIGVFVPLLILLAGTLALALGHPFIPHALNRLQFRLIVAVTVIAVSVGYRMHRAHADPGAPEDEPAALDGARSQNAAAIRCAFPLHNFFLLGIRTTLWVFRVVGVCWIALSILALSGELSPSRGATDRPEDQARRGESPTSASGRAKNGSGSEQTRVIAALLDETNRARRNHGLPPVALSEDLSAAAGRHAEDMLARGYFSHDSPEGTGPSERLREYVPRAIVLSLRENITKTEGDSGEGAVARSREVVDGWLRSKAHRDNLLNPESTQAGFGVAWKGRENGRVEYTVQMLGIVAGHWEVAPESRIRTPASWGATLDSPLEFFLKDMTRTGKSYADPDGKPGTWVGGVPLTVSQAAGRRSVIFPRLDPGRYQLMGRRPPESGWQVLRDVTVGP